MSNYLDCIGEIRYNHFGTPMKIIAARKKSDIDVQFLDLYGYVKEHSTYNSFKKGEIRNPYDRTANGIGYNGVGKYKTGGSAYDTKVFAIWYAILGRCYNEQRRDKSPSYEKCFICDEWMDYQKFRALEHGTMTIFIKLGLNVCILIKTFYIKTIKYIVLKHAL